MTSEGKTVADPQVLQKIQEDLQLLKKYGPGLSEKDIEFQKAEATRAAATVEKMRLHGERVAAEHERIVRENTRIAREELGTRIIVTLGNTRLKSLLPDGGVPCPQCGANLGPASGWLMMMANLVRGGNLRGQIRGWAGSDWGKPTQGIPCVHRNATCPSCGAYVPVLIQLVI